jgi:hypothetical protein
MSKEFYVIININDFNKIDNLNLEKYQLEVKFY